MYETRVAQVGKFYPPHMGGIETHLRTLCRELAKTCRVSAIVANDGPDTVKEKDGDVMVRRVGTKFHFAAAAICPELFPALRESRADVLHLHLPNPTATLAVLASGFKGPIVTTYHSDVVRQKYLGRAFEPFLHWVLKRSSAIVCTSTRYMETSPALVPYREKCIVIPYGIDVAGATEADPEEIASIRQQFGERLIIAVGRLVYYKGFEYLIEAMRTVHGKLLIIGDGPLRSALQELIAAHQLESRVLMLGEIQNDRLAPYYRAADVFAFPSVARSEAFGIVQLEAMACGLPVVNTALDSGVPFVSRHQETGITVPPRDAEALAEALNSLLENPAQCAAFAEAARRRVRADFTAEVMALRTSNLYAEVLAEARGFYRAPPAPRVPPTARASGRAAAKSKKRSAGL